MADFPSSVKTFPTLADLADSVLAAHQNDRGGEITAVETWLLDGPAQGTTTIVDLLKKLLKPGEMHNGRISVSVASNDLVLAIKTAAGADPSATDPVYININGTVRTIAAATSCTLADGTNWFNAGGAELATKEADYFAYAVWDSNSSVVAVAPARIPSGRLVSDFSSTTTNERYLGNYANYTSTDDVAVLGRFAATLSAGAGYTWTVPTYTNKNLIQHPIFETRWLDWQPAYSASGSLTYTSVTTTKASYKIQTDRMMIVVTIAGTLGGSASNVLYFTLAMNAIYAGAGGNGNTATVASKAWYISAGTPDKVAVEKYDGSNYATSGSCGINGSAAFIV